MNEMPERIPAAFMDRACSLLGMFMDMTITMECRFEHALDPERLAEAAMLCLDAEPVLACRWEAGDPQACWVRIEERSADDLFRQVASDAEFEAARRSMILPEIGPQLRLVHKAGEGDRLLIKMHHYAGDAGAAKEATALLADIYTKLGQNPAYRPEVNRKGSRELDQILRHVPWYAWPRIQLNHLAEIWRKIVPKSSHAVMVGDNGSKELLGQSAPITLRHLDADRVARLKQFGRPLGATLNDLLLAAFLRAQVSLVPWDGRSAFRLITTMDHRLHTLPTRRGEALANLSTFEFYNLGRKLGKDITETTRRVSLRTRRRKNSWFGMNPFVLEYPIYRRLSDPRIMDLGQKIVDLGVKAQNVANGLTNMGPIEPQQVCFDQPAVKAFLIAPPARRLMFLGGVTGYQGGLTLSGGAPDELIQGTGCGAFFDQLLAELPE